jgi:hypothetical protein
LEDSQGTVASPTITRPNFLIIGAAKSGTTALWHYLKQHPQIYMSPRKHTRHFSFEVEDPGFRGPGPRDPSVPFAIVDNEAYHELFGDATNEPAIGEASHSYLYRPEAPQRIREYATHMKLIAILRHPTERAFSHYRQMVRDGRESITDFVLALEEEESRVRDYWWPDFHYVQAGLYYDQLGRYFDLFDRDQIRIYIYEDFSANPYRVLRDIFDFLDVDPTFTPRVAARYNASGLPKNKVVQAFLQNLRRARPIVKQVAPQALYQSLLRVGSELHNQNLTKAGLSAEVRRRVTDDYFREDIQKLQGLIDRDLSAWLG